MDGSAVGVVVRDIGRIIVHDNPGPSASSFRRAGETFRREGARDGGVPHGGESRSRGKIVGGALYARYPSEFPFGPAFRSLTSSHIAVSSKHHRKLSFPAYTFSRRFPQYMTCQHTSGQVLYTRVQTNRFTSTNKFTSMSPERLVQAKQIFDCALELPQSERPLFVQKACAGDLDLESTIAALLSQDPEEIPSILATPGVASENAKTLPLESPILKNRYQIIKELDRGGMGVVFLAADLQLHNRPVVVKMLSDRLTNDSWYRAKFFQEIQVLARISHPCVVSVLDAGETSNGHPFLVMVMSKASSWCN